MSAEIPENLEEMENMESLLWIRSGGTQKKSLPDDAAARE
jgi:hypothetical protein